MTTTDPLTKEFVNIADELDDIVNELEVSDSNSETGSEISLSQKIVLESNEKRLRQRMTSLQNSIMYLKEQLRLEKELWKEDMQKIRTLQQQQEVMRCTCAHQTKPKESNETLKCESASRTSSNFTLGDGESNHTFKKNDASKTQSIKQLLELHNYKRKLAETENMCSLELNRVKQSLEDLKTLQSIATEWGKNEDRNGTEEKIDNKNNDSETIHEIFVNVNN